MAIGDQGGKDTVVSAKDLKVRYDELIKQAILRARPGLDVVRADEVAAPGAITSDIISRLLHSDYVVADITFPNPNVFYELGIRHACRSGTILIRESKTGSTPFDVASHRHISYESTLSGLKQLAESLEKQFAWFEENPGSPDNHVLEFAKIIGYSYPDFRKVPTRAEEQVEAMIAMFTSPDLAAVVARQAAGEQVSTIELFQALAKNPDAAKPIFRMIAGQNAQAEKKPEVVVPNRFKRRRSGK